MDTGRGVGRTASYNSPVPQMLTARLLFWRCLGSLLTVAILASLATAAEWNESARQLAQKIAASTGPGAVALDVVNRSSLAKPDVDAIHASLHAQLGTLGLRFVKPEQAAAVIEVSLSENLQSYIWVALIRQGQNEPAVVMVTLPRNEPANAIHDPAVMLLRKIQLWSQDDPILDVGVVDTSPPHLVVLEPNRIVLYGLQSSRWQQEQSFPIPHSQPWPRDLRGRIVLRKDHLFDAYLPGVSCSSSSSSPLSVSCRQSDDPWPVGTEPFMLSAFFSPTRNFFTGALAPGLGRERTVNAFYTAAPIPRDKYVLWLLAGVDGRIREVDGLNTQTIARSGWGSDIASLKTSCSSGLQVLATTNSDGVSPDTVRAFEFPDRDPVPASQPMEFNGSITSLWPEASGSSAVAVTHNARTGRYEAFRLAITCGQ
jgi:hypothetical protein